MREIRNKRVYTATIVIDRKNALSIRKYLETEPKGQSECFGEDERISYTAVFDDGREMDIQMCGVQFREGEANRPWTQAVLYDNGAELTFSDAEDYYFGTWELEWEDERYVVEVMDESQDKLKN
ncbi:MAG: hypothetical protein LUE86_14060 [Clostridiales bacterium]|nr:hypothetical protein [Clostridiales bacterium]